MKTIQYLFFSLLSISLLSCDDEDGFYNEKYVEIPDLVFVDPQPSFVVGDYFYVSADFSRFQPEPGFTTPLDIYETTSGAAGFVFSYTMEKEGALGEWAPISTAATEMDVIDGSVQAGSFILGTAVYNPADQTYEYRVGFPLLTAGNYRVSFGVNSDATATIELRSKTVGNKLFLNILSATSQLDGGGFYHFTVN